MAKDSSFATCKTQQFCSVLISNFSDQLVMLGIDADIALGLATDLALDVGDECATSSNLYLGLNSALLIQQRNATIFEAFTGNNYEQLAKAHGMAAFSIYRVISAQRAMQTEARQSRLFNDSPAPKKVQKENFSQLIARHAAGFLQRAGQKPERAAALADQLVLRVSQEQGGKPFYFSRQLQLPVTRRDQALQERFTGANALQLAAEYLMLPEHVQRAVKRARGGSDEQQANLFAA